MRFLYLSLRLFIVILFVTSTTVQAQAVSKPMQFRIMTGLASPTGDFSSTDGSKTAGYATGNFCATLEVSTPINQNLNWISSISLAVNGLDEGKRSEDTKSNVTAGNYVTTWGLTGLGFEAPLEGGSKIYGLFQGGFLFSSFPDITFSDGTHAITQTTTSGIALAFGVGAGLIINRFTIGIKYVAGEPEYERTASSGGSTATAKITLPANIILLEAGFNF
ncbi:MAG: hypothetical protein HYV28_01395 [Ignavibacteriales bacterium]|nr:hypothetical protein [Ignavibacteriales bacterium]